MARPVCYVSLYKSMLLVSSFHTIRVSRISCAFQMSRHFVRSIEPVLYVDPVGETEYCVTLTYHNT